MKITVTKTIETKNAHFIIDLNLDNNECLKQLKYDCPDCSRRGCGPDKKECHHGDIIIDNIELSSLGTDALDKIRKILQSIISEKR